VKSEKELVRDFWDEAACGEELYLHGEDRAAYEAQSRQRYVLEPYIADFANFNGVRGTRVLEIGVGLGADHLRFAQGGADLYGVDLTERAVKHTRRHLLVYGLDANVAVGDAENLAFPDDSFEHVYSWGVLHHSPDTPKAVAEVWRVLVRGGAARVMIYHKWSLIGVMLWLRYALLALKPWRSLKDIYATHLESPGTKAYTTKEARALFSRFGEVNIRTVLTHGDLLSSDAGQRHRGAFLTLAKKVWPRRLLARLFPTNGLFMLIDARK